MAKENVLPFAVILLLLTLPGTGLSNNIIQTTQRVIMIDPGHGGTDNGLVSSGGLKEKTVTLKLAQKTAQHLENRYNVRLTRKTDKDTPHRERVFTANNNAADLFLSIHLYYSNRPMFFAYYFDPPEPDTRPGSTADHTWKSTPMLHQAAGKQLIDSFSHLFATSNKAVRFFSTGAPVMPLEGTTMPAILIEPLSISTLPQHPEEIEKILDEYALLLSKSIDLYFKENKRRP